MKTIRKLQKKKQTVSRSLTLKSLLNSAIFLYNKKRVNIDPKWENILNASSAEKKRSATRIILIFINPFKHTVSDSSARKKTLFPCHSDNIEKLETIIRHRRNEFRKLI